MVRSEDGKTIRQSITDTFDGMILEQYLKKELQLTRAQIRSMKFRENGLMVNDVRVRISQILHTGDVLQIQLEEKRTASVQLEEMTGELEILYEDEDLIAVWKEAGIVVHPSHGHYKDTLSNCLHTYFQQQGKAVMIRSIGRLDRDTSGILVFAKNQVAAARLWKQKEEQQFFKEYLAVCQGKIENVSIQKNEENWYTIDAPIAPMEGELMKMCVSPKGKEAVTHFQILRYDEGKDCTLIRVRIDTGRTHQIRVHMAYIGHPLVKDLLYAKAGTSFAEPESENVQYPKEAEVGNAMYLCAWKVWLLQPFTGEPLEISRKMEK